MNILVTGASGGVGKAIVQQLIGGDRVMFLHYYQPSAKLLLSKLVNDQPHTHLLPADLTKEKDLITLLSHLKKKGGVEIIIHTVTAPTKLDDVLTKKPLDFQRHFDLQEI